MTTNNVDFDFITFIAVLCTAMVLAKGVFMLITSAFNYLAIRDKRLIEFAHSYGWLNEWHMMRLTALNAIYFGLLTVDEQPSLVKLVHYFNNGVDDLLLKCLKSHFSNTEEQAQASTMLEAYISRYVKRTASGELPVRAPNTKEILLGHINLYADKLKAKGLTCDEIDGLILVLQFQGQRSLLSVRG